jgi:hypothetical protein
MEITEIAAAFAEPPLRETAAGRLRTVGVEVEFGALSARRAAAALAQGLDGSVTAEDAHALLVKGTALGDLMVEIDTRYAHPQRHRGSRWGWLSTNWAARLATVSQPLIPRELVTAPMPVDRLALVDCGGRRPAPGGRVGGGADSVRPSLQSGAAAARRGDTHRDPQGVPAVNDWLRRESRPRRLSHRLGFGRNFPPAYVRKVVAADYWPSLDGLTEDYLAANPTRDRDLDLLPLLLHFDERRVRTRLPHEKIGRRAALHYRLPTARVSEPGWSVVPDWNRGWPSSAWRRTGGAGAPRRPLPIGPQKGWGMGRDLARSGVRSVAARCKPDRQTKDAALRAARFVRCLSARRTTVCACFSGGMALPALSGADQTAPQASDRPRRTGSCATKMRLLGLYDPV